MSNKSQLNNLSKREILESLLSKQQQDTSTVNRLVLALALATGIEAETLAQKFADAQATGEYAAKFNQALDAEFMKRQETASTNASGSEQSGEEPNVEAKS